MWDTCLPRASMISIHNAKDGVTSVRMVCYSGRFERISATASARVRRTTDREQHAIRGPGDIPSTDIESKGTTHSRRGVQNSVWLVRAYPCTSSMIQDERRYETLPKGHPGLMPPPLIALAFRPARDSCAHSHQAQNLAQARYPQSRPAFRSVACTHAGRIAKRQIRYRSRSTTYSRRPDQCWADGSRTRLQSRNGIRR